MQGLRCSISHDDARLPGRDRAAGAFRMLVCMLRISTIVTCIPATTHHVPSTAALVLLLVGTAESRAMATAGQVGPGANLSVAREILKSERYIAWTSQGNSLAGLAVVLAAALQLLTQHRDLMAALWALAARAVLDEPLHVELALRTITRGCDLQTLPDMLDHRVYLDRAGADNLELLLRVVRLLHSDTPVGLGVRLCHVLSVLRRHTHCSSHMSRALCGRNTHCPPPHSQLMLPVHWSFVPDCRSTAGSAQPAAGLLHAWGGSGCDALHVNKHVSR